MFVNDYDKQFSFTIDDLGKVIHPKYSKHGPYTVAYTIDCVYSKMLNHGFKSWVISFTFQAYTLSHTLNCICVSLLI